ncbi:MAG: hypothetical protein AAF824_07575 [Bacteroidota bacterium]
MIENLSIEGKLELLSQLTEAIKEEVKSSPVDKALLLEELGGAWKDSSDSLAEEILKARSASEKNIVL